MNPLLAVLQIVVVALGSAAVLAFLISNFRYRKLELLAEEEATSRPAISPSALVVHLLGELRKEQKILCRLQTPSAKDTPSLARTLRENCREGDAHFVVENGVVVSSFDCPPDHAERLGRRMLTLIQEHGVTEGACCIWRPELDTEALLTWILRGDNHELSRPPRLTVTVEMDAEPEKADSPASPAIDPVTGVYREDRVSRVMRRRLADRSRVKGEVVMMRVFVPGTATGQECDESMHAVAELLMDHCRETDIIGRSGEREFVLCVDGGREDLEKAARRMQAVIQSSGFPVRFGLAAMPEHGDSPGLLYERAGLALESLQEESPEKVGWFDPSRVSESAEGVSPGTGKEEF